MLIEVRGPNKGLDGHDSEARRSSAPGETLSSVLAAVRMEAFRRGEVVSRLFLDGTLLTDERERECAQRPAGEFTRLEAASCERGDFLGTLLRGVLDTISQLERAALEAADAVRTGADVRQRIAPIAEGLQIVLDATDQCARYCRAARFGPQQPAATGGSRLEASLEEILAGLAARDGVRIGDGLEHELVPTLKAMSADVEGLLQEVAAIPFESAIAANGKGTHQG